MSQSFKMTRAAELEVLGVFRDYIESSGQQFGIDDETIFQLQLAVDEACSNIITHGYAGMNPGSIILELKFRSDFVLVNITDFGHPFEPSPSPKPDVEALLEDRLAGGFGLYFIYQTMDEVDYKTSEEGNILTFIKQL